MILLSICLISQQPHYPFIPKRFVVGCIMSKNQVKLTEILILLLYFYFVSELFVIDSYEIRIL